MSGIDFVVGIIALQTVIVPAHPQRTLRSGALKALVSRQLRRLRDLFRRPFQASLPVEPSPRPDQGSAHG